MKTTLAAILTATATLTICQAADVQLTCAINAANPWSPREEELADSPPGALLPIGTPIVYTYLVSRSGFEFGLGLPVDLLDEGSDPLPDDNFEPVYVEGDLNDDGLLDVGETWLFTSQGVFQGAVTEGLNYRAASLIIADDGFLDYTFHYGIGEAPTPDELVTSLIDKVSALPKAQVKFKQGLVSKLKNAAAAINSHDTNAACAAIRSFLNQVRAKLRNNQLDPVIGVELREQALEIQLALGCPSKTS